MYSSQVDPQVASQVPPQLAQVPAQLASHTVASQLTAVGPQNGLQSRDWTWSAIAWPWTVPRVKAAAGVVSNESTRSSSTDNLTLRMSSPFGWEMRVAARRRMRSGRGSRAR